MVDVSGMLHNQQQEDASASSKGLSHTAHTVYLWNLRKVHLYRTRSKTRIATLEFSFYLIGNCETVSAKLPMLQ